MPQKNTILLFLIIAIFMPKSVWSETTSLTVLTKLESHDGFWTKYWYKDKRKIVFEQNKVKPHKPHYSPEQKNLPHPSAFGYTKYQRSEYTMLKPASVTPKLKTMKYGESGRLEREEWDVDGDNIMDRYFLYTYNRNNKLVEKKSFVYGDHKAFESIRNEYDKKGNLKAVSQNENFLGQSLTRNRYYNSKEQLIKSEWTTIKNLHDGYELYHYRSGLRIRKEKHNDYGEYNEYYFYDDDGRLVENKYRDITKKYQYNKNGKLHKYIEIESSKESTRTTSYFYKEGLLARVETDFESDAVADIVSYYYYDRNGYCIRDEWDRNDGIIRGWTKYSYETIDLK